MEATYILKSSAIFDSVKDVPYPGGVVVSGNKIIGIFPTEELSYFTGSNTKVIDYGDRLILPGFIDSHMHAGQAMDYEDNNFCIDIGNARSFPELAHMMQDWGTAHPDAKIIFGTNYNFFNLEGHHIPTLQEMDSYFPDRPALLQTWEIHSIYANSVALKMAGITAESPDPNHSIGKNPDGSLSGVVNDTAAFALQKLLVRPLEERKSSLLYFMKELNRYGITAIGDLFPCGPQKPYALYKAMEDQLSVRIHFYPELLSFTPDDIANYKRNFHSPMLQFSGLKNLIDGVISVHTAWMTEPYADQPDTCGAPAVPAEEVRQKMLQALAMGINVRIHTIGDQAVHYVLDVFEEAEQKYGRLPRHNVMEHLEYVQDADIPRFAALDVIPDMQGRHITFYVDEAARIMGKERAKLAFRWRDIYRTGATIGTGTDYPVVHFSPFTGIYAAITRSLESGYPKGGWLPEQCMTLPEMLKICTFGSACAINRESDLGTLQPGKLADITVLDRNLFHVPTEEILDTMPVMTMVDGKIVFQK